MHSASLESVNLTLYNKGEFADGIRVLRWEIILDYQGGHWCHHKCPLNGRAKETWPHKQKAMWSLKPPALVMEEGARSQGTHKQHVSRSWNMQGGSSPGASGRNRPFDIRQWHWFWTWQLERINMRCFKLPGLRQFVRAAPATKYTNQWKCVVRKDLTSLIMTLHIVLVYC